MAHPVAGLGSSPAPDFQRRPEGRTDSHPQSRMSQLFARALRGAPLDTQE